MAPQLWRGFITELFLRLGEIAVLIEFVDLAQDEFRLGALIVCIRRLVEEISQVR